MKKSKKYARCERQREWCKRNLSITQVLGVFMLVPSACDIKCMGCRAFAPIVPCPLVCFPHHPNAVLGTAAQLPRTEYLPTTFPNQILRQSLISCLHPSHSSNFGGFSTRYVLFSLASDGDSDGGELDEMTFVDKTTDIASDKDSISETGSAGMEAWDANHGSLANGNKQEWDVYICQSKAFIDRGAGATLDAFIGLAPPDKVSIHPAILSKTKGKGPNVRCLHRTDHGQSFEVNNVDSVDKVYRILTKHMNIGGINASACECLKWNYRGNEYLEKGEISEAINAYDKAIEAFPVGTVPHRYVDQEGIILLMRATAYLKRAAVNRRELQIVVRDLTKAVPDPTKLQTLYSDATKIPSLSNSIFKRVLEDCKSQDKKFQNTKYWHGLYQFALLHAAQDSLRATQLLPDYAKTWLLAGEILAELWKLKESSQYYEKAIELDSSLSDTLRPVIERLQKRQDFLDNARAYGCSEDTLRLALDVAG